jgi:hypothetical protein
MMSETIFLENRLYLYYTKRINFYIKMHFTTTKEDGHGSISAAFLKWNSMLYNLLTIANGASAAIA